MLSQYIHSHYVRYESKSFGWLWIAIATATFIFSFCLVESLALGKRSKQNYDYKGAQVLNVERCNVLNTILEENNLDVWSGNGTHLHLMVPANKVNSLTKKLKDELIPYQVMIQDLGPLVNQNIHATKFRNVTHKKKASQMNWERYQRLYVIHDYMDSLAVNFPDIVQVDIMGNSKEGRPLKYVKILSENRTSSNAIFIDGGVHGREWVSPSSVTYIIKELVENRSQQPSYLKNLDLYILPVLNPDGYEYTFTEDRLWRKNRSKNMIGSCAGTDINRNFDFNWAQKGSSVNPCSEVYRGDSPASEPETKALSKFMMGLKGKIGAYISYHNYGQYILLPYGYDINVIPRDYSELKMVGDEACKNIYKASGVMYEAGNSATLSYPAAGCSSDWAKGVAGVKYSFIVELRDKGNYSFLMPTEEIIPTAIDALEALKAIASATYRL